MKLQALIIFLLPLVVFLSCKKEVTPEPEEQQIVDLNDYFLLDTSIESIPYLGKESVSFVDSLGNQIKFTIEENEEWLSSILVDTYDISPQGDTIRYQYEHNHKYFRLVNTSLNLRFTVHLEPELYYINNNERVADVCYIYYEEGDLSLFSFHDFVNTRTLGDNIPSFNNEWEEITFIDRVFENVIETRIAELENKCYFNYTEGIVAFSTYAGKTWRFEKFDD